MSIIKLNNIQYPINEICNYFISALPLNVFVVNRNGSTAWANQTTLTKIGLNSLEDFLKLHINHWGQDKWYCCQEVMDLRKEISVEEPDIEGNRYYWTTRKPIIKDNIVQGVLGVSLDITERKQKIERIKSQFLENICHDIRTPLSGIIGMAALMQATPSGLAERDYPMYAESLIDSGNALLNFLNCIIDSVKAGIGTRVVNLQRCSLLEIAENIEKLYQSTAIQKGLEFVVEKDDTALSSHIIGDSLRIRNILIELISNAVKYTKQGFVKCILQLEKESHAWTLVLRVEDSGIGIPADKQNVIFDRFTRLNKAYEGIYNDSGLGLSNVKKLLQDLKADIRVESTVGVGSAFTCRIPVQC